jgi:hypothetical protein
MSRSAHIANRVFNFALTLYPAEFRERYAECMACVFSEACAEEYRRSGAGGVLVLLAKGLGDVAKSATGEHIALVAPKVGFTSRVSFGATLAVHAVLLSLLLWFGLHAPPVVSSRCERKTQLNAGAHYSPATPRTFSKSPR